MNLLSIYVLNFSSFYDRLNEVGKLVFYIVLLLFLILIVLIVMAVIQSNTKDIIEKKQIRILKEDEKKLDEIKKANNRVEISVDETNEKTRDLKKIVEEIKKVTYDVKQDVTDIYEDEQEKTAIISYDELVKGNTSNTTITVPKEETLKTRDFDANEIFLKSLKEFRKNL